MTVLFTPYILKCGCWYFWNLGRNFVRREGNDGSLIGIRSRSSGLNPPDSGQDSGPRGTQCWVSSVSRSLPTVLRVARPSSVVPKTILAPYCVLLAWRVSRSAFVVAVSDVFAGGGFPGRVHLLYWPTLEL